MKRTVILLITLALATLFQAKTVNSVTIDDGGSGAYKAVMVGDDLLSGYTIYRPSQLQTAAKVEGPLPVLLFSNGACARNSKDFARYLTELASHGYVVLSIGEWNNREYDPMKENPPLNDRQSLINVEDARALLRAVEWLERENNDEKSEYYQAVNTDCMASLGQSCGGLQSLIIGTSGDKRIRTVVALNSGANNPGDKLDKMFVKESLKKLAVPTAYIIGGPKDIAYQNALDDYRRISHIPIVLASHTESGHGGTYRELHGGTFAKMTLAWLNLQLKGQKQNESLFRYADTGNDFAGWVVKSKNMAPATQIIRLYETPAGETTEKVEYNEFGQVDSYSKVTDPTMTVCLPDPDKATGAAVVIQPGGALVQLAWESEFMNAARWLNARGIAAIGVKYRLRDKMPPMPAGVKPMRLNITEADQIRHANINPSLEPARADGTDVDFDHAVEDVVRAVKQVRRHAAEWGISPDKIGMMGFSAGGCVSLGAVMRANDEIRPAFLCSVYGPSMIDVTVPKDAPRIFIAVHADHPNVAAGCLALFMEWKKTGIDAEMHIYGQHTGGLFGGGHGNVDSNTPQGSWLESFYSWLVANKLL